MGGCIAGAEANPNSSEESANARNNMATIHAAGEETT